MWGIPRPHTVPRMPHVGWAGVRRAATAGGGVRISWGDRVESNFTVAVPLERAGLQTRRGDVRLLFTIAARLAPWKSS